MENKKNEKLKEAEQKKKIADEKWKNFKKLTTMKK